MAGLRIPGPTSRLSIIVLLSIALAAGCSGGGGAGPATSSGGGAVGPAAIDVSLDAGTANSPLAASATAADLAAGFQSVNDLGAFRHVYMEVVKIALRPVNDSDFDGEDMELEDGNGSGQSPAEAERSGWVTLVPSSPTVFDLLNLQKGKKLARLLNHFDSIPAGTYDKIRVFYRNVRVVLTDGSEVRFHPTAHSHFDLHFVNGKELVVPVTTDTTQPDSWIKFFKVKLDVVGLMIRVIDQGRSWKGAKVILRPQIFVEFVPPILYSIAGRAFDVSPANTASSGTFDISAVGRTIPAAYTDTTDWFFNDNVLAGSDWIVPVTGAIGSQALQDGAIVEAIGRFDSALVFIAGEISITFPDERSGLVANGWRLDNTFVIRQAGDNVVFPKPSRATAYYDNAVAPHEPLDSSAIDNNVRVRARGYTAFENNVAVGINAFWISIGP